MHNNPRRSLECASAARKACLTAHGGHRLSEPREGSTHNPAVRVVTAEHRITCAVERAVTCDERNNISRRWSHHRDSGWIVGVDKEAMLDGVMDVCPVVTPQGDRNANLDFLE